HAAPRAPRSPPTRRSSALPAPLDGADEGHLRGVGPPVEHRLAGEQPADGHAVEPPGEDRLAVVAVPAVALPGHRPRLDRVRPAQDRKSTRLNSSHVKISYA